MEINKTYGLFYQLGWKNINDESSTLQDQQLTSIHESFHNELNNLTAYGSLLMSMATIVLSDKNQTDYRTQLKELVLNSKNVHEIYATFLSVCVLSMKYGYQQPNPEKLLENYPSYLVHYNKGELLSIGFKGTYLKEVALTAIIISCMQGKVILDNIRIDRKVNGKEKSNDIDFPDGRLMYLIDNLPSEFINKSYKRFSKFHEHQEQIRVLDLTETDPSYYSVAIQENFDSVQRKLIEHFVQDLVEWFNTSGLLTIDFFQNQEYSKKNFEALHKFTSSKDSKFILKYNDRLNDYERNVLINFSSETYIIRKAKWKAEIKRINKYSDLLESQIVGGTNENEHIFLVARTAVNLVEQYQYSSDDLIFLKEQEGKTIVFIRGKIKDIETDENKIIIHVITSPSLLVQLKKEIDSIPIISNISMEAWLSPGFNNEWFKKISELTFMTILFDLYISEYIIKVFSESCNLVLMQKAKLELEGSSYIALILQGEINNSKNVTPYFFLPLSTTTSNVVSNYLLRIEDEVKFIEDKNFTSHYKRYINMVLSRFYQEERSFRFNTI